MLISSGSDKRRPGQRNAMDTLGISVGDKVRTHWGDTIYRVKSIWGPYWWWQHRWFEGAYGGATIYPYPVISLIVREWDKEHDSDGHLNTIHRDGDRWCNSSGDEIFVEKCAPVNLIQTGLFAVEEEKDDPRRRPYVFDPGVDYSNPRLVYKCGKCKRDFNSPDLGVVECRECKYCGKYGSERIFVAPVVHIKTRDLIGIS